MLRTIHLVEMQASDPLGANGLCKAVLELSLAQSRAADVHLVIHGAWPGGRPAPEEVTRHGGSLLNCARALRKLARDDTVVHVHSVWSWLVLAPLLIPRFRACRFVLSPHGAFAAQALRSSAAKKKLFLPVLRIVLKAFHQVHAASEKELAELTRLATGMPIVIVPNAVSEPGITAARTTKRKRIGYLGRIHPLKGVLDLIRAWGAIERDYPDWELRIVGDPHDRAYWREVVKEAEGSTSISFSPAIDPGAVWRFLGACELVAVPSLSENFCYVVAEACLAGTAVVMTDQVPWPQSEGGDLGWRGPSGVEGVMHSLRAALAADSRERRLRADRGRRFIQLACSPARVGRRSLDAYAQIFPRGAHVGAPQGGALGSTIGRAEQRHDGAEHRTGAIISAGASWGGR
jgi:glycosyltransferase involved in cell wall biosynthesis